MYMEYQVHDLVHSFDPLHSTLSANKHIHVHISSAGCSCLYRPTFSAHQHIQMSKFRGFFLTCFSQKVIMGYIFAIQYHLDSFWFHLLICSIWPVSDEVSETQPTKQSPTIKYSKMVKKMYE